MDVDKMAIELRNLKKEFEDFKARFGPILEQAELEKILQEPDHHQPDHHPV